LANLSGCGGATRTLSRDKGVEELHGASHCPRSDQKSKKEKVVPKMARRRGSDVGQSRRRCVRFCRECPAGATRRILPFYPA